MEKRVSGQEPEMPWFLHDKLKCYRFCEEHGIATAQVMREFGGPEEIDLTGLKDTFVLKPTLQSSTKGVMVLTPLGRGFYDDLRERKLSFAEIIVEQTRLFDTTKATGKKIIVERKISDVDGYEIPRDFKAYAFRGKVALILEINRNTTPTTVSWFDGNFKPVTDSRVTSNPQYVHEIPGTPPDAAQELLALAEKTSAAVPTPFASIDMYSTKDGPIVGEITLAPGGLYHGLHYTLSDKQQELMGQYWQAALKDLGQSDPVVSTT